MKKLLLGALVALVAGPAMAADLRAKAPVYKAPPPAPAYGWAGFYVGLNAGYGWGHTSGAIESFDPASQIFLTASGFPPNPFGTSFRQSGGIAGAQAGYNWQFSGDWVGGFEADIQYAHVRGNGSNVLFLAPANLGTTFPFNGNFERTLEWFGTVRGRLGYLAAPSLLVYGTAGLAYGRTTANGNISLAPPPGIGDTLTDTLGSLTFSCSATGPASTTCYSGSNSRISAGWTAGAGFEFKVAGNLTAKLEYLHVDLGGQTVTLISPPPSTPGVFIGYRFDHERVDILRAGINYRFDAPGAVVAKY